MPRRNEKADAAAQAFGLAVHSARLAQGLTAETVAGRVVRTRRDGESTTMDPKYLLSIEGGWHSPTISTAKKLSEALGLPLSDLVADL